MLVTVQNITDTAIDLADMRDSYFIDQTGSDPNTLSSELLRYTNLAYQSVYNICIQANERYFTQTYQIGVVGGTDTYSLPSDFKKLDGVDLIINATTGQSLTLFPAMFSERNKFRMPLYYPPTAFGNIYKYIVTSTSITFLPIPNVACNVQLWYTPEPAIITTLSQQIQIPLDCQQYMISYIASAMLSKGELNTQDMAAMRAEVLQALRTNLKERDSGAPNYVADSTMVNAGVFWPNFNGNW